MKNGEPLTLPHGYPQERAVVIEQLNVLKSLQKKDDLKINNSATPIQTCSRGENTEQIKIKNKSDNLTMIQKLHIARPYNIFFTSIPESSETIKCPNSITISGTDYMIFLTLV